MNCTLYIHREEVVRTYNEFISCKKAIDQIVRSFVGPSIYTDNHLYFRDDLEGVDVAEHFSERRPGFHVEDAVLSGH